MRSQHVYKKIKRPQLFCTSKRRLLPCCWATAAAAATKLFMVGGATAGVGGAFLWWNKNQCPSLTVVDLAEFKQNRKAIAEVIGKSLSTQGFLYLRSPHLSKEDLIGYLKYVENSFSDLSGVEKHTKDPKEWAMFERSEILSDPKLGQFAELVKKLEIIKDQILESMEISLELEPGSFLDHHKARKSFLRAIHYFPLPENSSVGNRCKEHTDYESVTLLIQPNNSGLEIWDEISGTWLQADKGAEDGLLVVNIGGLLQAWSVNKFKATIHRVAGPGSEGSVSENKSWNDRYSLAYFTGPDAELKLENIVQDKEVLKKFRNVWDYVEWRCKQTTEDQSDLDTFPRSNPAMKT